MNCIMMMFMTIMSLTVIMMMMMILISKKSMTDTQKASPFECGFNPMSYSRLPFSIHFFMIAVIFLIFDIEIIMIMPMIMTTKSSMVVTWTITSSTFTIILITGLYHEWLNGMINWTS